jgi:hypothetical protein
VEHFVITTLYVYKYTYEAWKLFCRLGLPVEKVATLGRERWRRPGPTDVLNTSEKQIPHRLKPVRNDKNKGWSGTTEVSA